MKRNDLTTDQAKVLYYLEKCGPAYAKKLAEILEPGAQDSDWSRAEAAVKALEKAGFVERVSGTHVFWRDHKGNRIVKHMNHTYYRTTKPGRRLARALDPAPEVPLSPPYVRASS